MCSGESHARDELMWRSPAKMTRIVLDCDLVKALVFGVEVTCVMALVTNRVMFAGEACVVEAIEGRNE